jgi:hypothetical protein
MHRVRDGACIGASSSSRRRLSRRAGLRQEAETIVAAMMERVLLGEGARVRAQEDLELAEADMAAGFETLPPA